MIWHLLGLFIACLVLIKSSQLAVASVLRIARAWKLREFVISFIIVGFVSSFPETFVSVVSALTGNATLGLGTIIGANIADLSIIIGIVALIGHKIKVTQHNILDDSVYLILCTLPIALGLDGLLSRIDGLILIGACFLFIYHVYHEEKHHFSMVKEQGVTDHFFLSWFLFFLSIVLIYFSATFVVQFASALALDLHVPAFLIGLVVISLGTCLPELFFAISSVKRHHDGLAIGDILGNVVIDATFVIGLTVVIAPIHFHVISMLISGIFLVLFTLLLIYSIRLRKMISLNTGLLLIFLYVLFVFLEVLLRL